MSHLDKFGEYHQVHYSPSNETDGVCVDKYATTWVYDCGWRIKGCHPYRSTLFGDQCLDQPIGILEFYRETGALPVTKDVREKIRFNMIRRNVYTGAFSPSTRMSEKRVELSAEAK